MLYRLWVSALVMLGFVTATASGQTPSLAVFDEATLQQAGVATDAASLLHLLHEHTRTDAEPEKINSLITQLASPQFERREAATRQLIAAGRPALSSLKEAQKHNEDPEVRQGAAHCVAAIESLLDPNLLMAAVRRLIYLRADGAAGPLVNVLPLVDWEIHDEIFHGLPRVALRDGKLDPALLAALEDEMPLRRAAAALTIALTGSGEQLARVRKMLDDREAEVRLRAAQGLLAVRDTTSLPVLIALLNDPAVEISWSAEELLHWVAGAKAPAEKIGAASVSEREKAVVAWTAWLQTSGRHLDWDQLEQAPRRPGLYLACDENTLWLGGCDGVRRWSQPMRNPAHDAMLFPGNRVVVVPCNDRTEVVQWDLDGKVLWSLRQRIFHDYVVCQRLPNGHCLLVSDLDIVEITAEGREVSEVPFAESLSVHDALLPREFGPLLCREREGVTAVDRSSGRIVCTGEMPRCELSLCKFAVQPDGRCAIANSNNRLLEVNCGGQTLRALPVCGARSVEALRNGHYLVSTFDQDFRLLELDAAGHTLWEVYTPRTVHRVRSILDKVRIGFDKPRPPDFNLDSAAQRVRFLRDPDPQVRARAMRFLHFLQPTDPVSIAAIVTALNDDAEGVRPTALTTLAAIGEPAVAELVDALRTKKRDDRIHLVTALAGIGPAAHKAVPELIALLDNADLSVELRRGAVSALGEIGPDAKKAMPVILKILKGDSLQLRCTIPNTLSRIALDDPTVQDGLLMPGGARFKIPGSTGRCRRRLAQPGNWSQDRPSCLDRDTEVSDGVHRAAPQCRVGMLLPAQGCRAGPAGADGRP